MHATTLRPFFLTLLLAVPALAQPGTPAAPSAALTALLDAHYDQMMRESPVQSTQRGDTRFNDRLADVSAAGLARSRADLRDRLAALNALDIAGLPANERLNATLLKYSIDTTLDGARFFPEHIPLDNREGPQIDLPQMADRLTFNSPKQFMDFAARLEAIAPYLDATIVNMRAGLAAGRMPPKVVVGQTAAQAAVHASEAIKANPTTSLFFRPFLVLAASDPAAARARKAVETGVVPAYGRLAAFLKDEYIPACRDSIAAADGKDGLPFYEHALRRETTTPLTADEIHQIGVREVARIRAEMFRVIARSDFPQKDTLQGDALFEAFTDFLRSNPRFYHTSKESLLDGYRLIAKRVDPDLARLFKVLPRNPYGVREMPAFVAPSSPTAYYNPGSLKGGVPGYFLANTYQLDQRPKYEMISLTLHEACPGHHLQIALSDELEGVHPFRQLLGYTAFVEGWALYSERLGLEMAGAPLRTEAAPGVDDTGGTGLFTDPYDDFGRLTYEMWRATRLVVDTGIHAKGWTRQRAVDFMLANSALSRLNIEREVDRYISWPGQACAYKLGELKVRELRHIAQKTLAERFDIRAFHDWVLGAGAMPLPLLEERVLAFIHQAKPANP
ncbi:MAG: DUF885 domain-containing protein [Phycisphaerales bacterium]